MRMNRIKIQSEIGLAAVSKQIILEYNLLRYICLDSSVCSIELHSTVEFHYDTCAMEFETLISLRTGSIVQYYEFMKLRARIKNKQYDRTSGIG